VTETPRSTVSGLARKARVFPRQFWLLAGGTFLYLLATSVAFPYTAILIHRRLDVSVAVVGMIMGGTALAGLPLQLVAGSLSDRFGRRGVMILCASGSVIMYGGMAMAHNVALVCILVFCDRALGWPMYLTASNAMVADLVRERLRPEGYSLVRLMIGAGEVVGPLIAAAVLAAGASIPLLFAVAGSGSFAYLLFTLGALKETHPARARRGSRSPATTDGGDMTGRGALLPIPELAAENDARSLGSAARGYGRVLADRRFLGFCAVSMLPLLIFGQLYMTFPIVLTSSRHLSPSTFGYVMSFMALLIVLTQYPLVHSLRRFDPMHQVAAASLLFGVGLGLTAFVPALWPLLLVVAVLALAQALFGPVTSTIVANMAPPELRGRYMGAWTLIWIGGQGSLGPLGGGIVLRALGPEPTYGLVIAMGLAGACLYPTLRRRRAALAAEA
jgi:MFS family permease